MGDAAIVSEGATGGYGFLQVFGEALVVDVATAVVVGDVSVAAAPEPPLAADATPATNVAAAAAPSAAPIALALLRLAIGPPDPPRKGAIRQHCAVAITAGGSRGLISRPHEAFQPFGLQIPGRTDCQIARPTRHLPRPTKSASSPARAP